MIIKFKKKKLYTHLILGLFWIGFGIAYFFLNSQNLSWVALGFTAIGVFDLLHFFYNLKMQYLSIKNNSIRKNILYGFKNKIELDEIQDIKKNDDGDYILSSHSTNFKINPGLIEKESLNELHKFLNGLETDSKIEFYTT